jgi:hypothetical protein
MTVPATPACPAAPTHLPAHLQQELQRHFSRLRVAYIASVLSAEELRIIGDLRDALIIARINRMPPRRLERFDRYVPADPAHQRAYAEAQVQWLHGEHYLLGTRLGRSPTHAELLADFVAHRNGQRFRAYYVLKHPERMKVKARAMAHV